jgi:hypothetical protein
VALAAERVHGDGDRVEGGPQRLILCGDEQRRDGHRLLGEVGLAGPDRGHGRPWHALVGEQCRPHLVPVVER